MSVNQDPHRRTRAGRPRSRCSTRWTEAAFQRLRSHLDQLRMTRHSPTLAQVAAITGTFVNVTSGIVPS